MFDYALPSDAMIAASKKPDEEKPEHGQKPGKPGEKKPGKDQPVHTQMIGEKPGDDLGYDPKKIPVEEIPDD